VTLVDTIRFPGTFSGARWSRFGRRWVSPLALLALWEAGSRLGAIPPRVLAAPSAVASTFWGMVLSGELASNLAVSFGRVAVGLLVGVFVGSVLALTAGLSRLGEDAIDPPIQMLRTLPVVALSPLFIVWFGIDETPKVALIALAVTFPVYLNLFSGVRSVDPKLIEAARSFGVRGFALIQQVILPAALPSFLLGVRFALAVAVLVLVVAEQINAQAGLGYLINNARDFLRTDIIVVCLVIYAFLGLGADAIVRAIEARVLAWRPSILRH
jgi:sulfonate transport system permease protein